MVKHTFQARELQLRTLKSFSLTSRDMLLNLYPIKLNPKHDISNNMSCFIKSICIKVCKYLPSGFFLQNRWLSMFLCHYCSASNLSNLYSREHYCKISLHILILYHQILYLLRNYLTNSNRNLLLEIKTLKSVKTLK